MLTALKKIGLTAVFTLLAVVSFAQNNVRLLNGSAFISEPAANAADTRLATELPNHDVRISYVTSFVGVQDRYKVYEGNDLSTFSQLPNPGSGFVPATQEQKDAAVNVGIHHAITTLPSPSEETIHIIYAVSVSLDAQGNEVFSSRKFFQFGSNVDRRSEKIVEQIIPDPELFAAGIVGSNDTYLADYVEELIVALNDPDYVVNGTIEFEGNTYYDGEVIYYLHEEINQEGINVANEILEGEPAIAKNIKLLINESYPINSINWFESYAEGDGPLLIAESSSSATPTLGILREHFGTVLNLTVQYDGSNSNFQFIPFNPLIEPDNLGPFEINAAAYLNDGIQVPVSVKNNHAPLNAYPGLDARLYTVTQAEGETNPILFENSTTPELVPDFSWQWSQECKWVGFRVYLKSSLKEIKNNSESIRLKCPFDLTSISVTSYDNDDQLNSARTVTGDDTLYIVSSDNNVTRKIQYKVNYNGTEPVYNEDNVLNDYWLRGPLEDEPIIDLGSIVLGTKLNSHVIESFPEEYKNHTRFDVRFSEAPFPGSGIFNPLGGTINTEVNYFNVEYNAFGNTVKTNLAFLRENRHETDVDISFLKELFTMIGATMLQAGINLCGSDMEVPGIPPNPSETNTTTTTDDNGVTTTSTSTGTSNWNTSSTGDEGNPNWTSSSTGTDDYVYSSGSNDQSTASTYEFPPDATKESDPDKWYDWYYKWNHTTFNQEDAGPLYLNVREQSVGGGIEAKSKELELPYPRIPPNPLIEGFFYLRLGGSVGLAYERASQKLFNEEEFVFAAQTIEIAGGLGLDLGGTIRTNRNLPQTVRDFVNLNFDVFLSYPVEVKGKLEFPVGQCMNRYFEFNHGPGSLNVNLGLSFVGSIGTWDYDWTLLDVSHSFPLTDKVFYQCCSPYLSGNCNPDPNCSCGN